jgi:RNA polymerase sigma factor (sigma-70 family)
MLAPGKDVAMQGGSELKILLSAACGRAAPASPVPPGAPQLPPDPRARDAAFNELLRLVMIFVRAGMGRKLRDHRESVDVCQSIARSFVEDFEAGKLEFESEAALAAYLKKVVRSKLVDLSRHDTRDKRGGAQPDLRIDSASLSAAFDPPSTEPTASFDARTEEARARILSLLSDDEQTLARLRWRGLSWEQIAAQLGKDPAALRQQFSRMQRRITEHHTA